jgi:hypothetical protein
MSVVKTIVLICDCDQVMIGEGENKVSLARICHREVEGYVIADVRKKAKDTGWAYIKPKGMRSSVDLCVTHAEAYNQHQVEEDLRAKRAKDPTVRALMALEDPTANDLEDSLQENIEPIVDQKLNQSQFKPKKSHKKKIRVEDFSEAS